MSRLAISLLLPTRGRCELLRQTLEGVFSTAADADSIEVLLYVDDDDVPSREMPLPDARVIRHVGPAMRMGRLTNELFTRSHGEHVLLFNDDIICRTPGWDHLLLGAAGRFRDGVCLAYGNDGVQGANLPTFPFLPRRTCELLGGICPDELRHDYIDTHLLDIFLCLRELGADRLVYVENVLFEHLLAEKTHVLNRELQQQDELAYLAWRDERRYLAWRLRRACSQIDSTGEKSRQQHSRH